jgi:hypothetical protein
MVSTQFMIPVTIFVTYNPKNEFEQTLAVRLHTLGGVSGFNMLLPDRYNFPGKLNEETAYRIRSADYFVFFSTSRLSAAVKNEIQLAYTHLNDKSKIIIVYDGVKNIKHNVTCTEIIINSKTDSIPEILNKTIDQINKKAKPASVRKNKKNAEATSAIGAILLIGIGMLALKSASSSSK